MKGKLLSIGLAILFVPALAMAGYVKDYSGNNILSQIRDNYNTVYSDCGTQNRPAILCSGVIIRARGPYNPKYHAWDPSPAQIAKSGVSFSYLRRDFTSKGGGWFAYGHNNGYIFYPVLNAPVRVKHIHYLCAFPLDAGTDYRKPNACRMSPPSLVDTDICQRQKNAILTGPAWYNKYQGYTGNYTCGFDILDNNNPPGGAANGFKAFVDAVYLYSSKTPEIDNEIISELWRPEDASTLPMQAFFYLSGTNGKIDAMKNQIDYADVTGIWVPIIEVKFPDKTVLGGVEFYYSEAEQAIREP